MNFKELNYIHELLVKNVDNIGKDWQQAHNKKKETEMDDEHYQLLEEICFEKHCSLKGAEEVLRAFEEHEW